MVSGFFSFSFDFIAFITIHMLLLVVTVAYVITVLLPLFHCFSYLLTALFLTKTKTAKRAPEEGEKAGQNR